MRFLPKQLDMSLAKNFGLKWLFAEKANLQFRAEGTNALNHVNFSDASVAGNIGNATTFGKSTSVTTPRFFQLATRLSF